ncbi:MAG: hypothetical protein HZB25_08835 [Candidatus Eisenbacteria bacterium]|nr:hypothetical protein [Candidatus Eisenbacteria bacterium]
MFVPVISPQRLVAPPEDWGALRDFIHESTGVHYADPRLPLLVERLQGRLKTVDAQGAHDLLLRLKYDETGQELRQLRDLAAPHESGFFREAEQLDALVEEVLPPLGGEGPVRVWSVGCGAGEEAYSLRYRLGQDDAVSERGLEVLGWDLSERCVADARRGEYRGAAVRDVPETVKPQLFEDRAGMLRVRDRWRQGVSFEAGNLLELEPGERAEPDAVFCRNVMMYFSETSRKRAAAVLYECLRDGGFLFLGKAESLHGVSRAFRPVTFRRGLGYRKD